MSAILADVRKNGDKAIVRYAKKFDHADLKASQFKVSASDILSAYARLSSGERTALKAAHRSIASFNKRGQSKGWSARNPQGAKVGAKKFDPTSSAWASMCQAGRCPLFRQSS